MVTGFTLREGNCSVLCLHLQVYRRQRCGGDEQVIKERALGVRFLCK